MIARSLVLVHDSAYRGGQELIRFNGLIETVRSSLANLQVTFFYLVGRCDSFHLLAPTSSILPTSLSTSLSTQSHPLTIRAYCGMAADVETAFFRHRCRSVAGVVREL
jgi:hypothetical protein